jgi:hypothetical protein
MRLSLRLLSCRRNASRVRAKLALHSSVTWTTPNPGQVLAHLPGRRGRFLVCATCPQQSALVRSCIEARRPCGPNSDEFGGEFGEAIAQALRCRLLCLRREGPVAHSSERQRQRYLLARILRSPGPRPSPWPVHMAGVNSVTSWRPAAGSGAAVGCSLVGIGSLTNGVLAPLGSSCRALISVLT